MPINPALILEAQPHPYATYQSVRIGETEMSHSNSDDIAKEIEVKLDKKSLNVPITLGFLFSFLRIDFTEVLNDECY